MNVPLIASILALTLMREASSRSDRMRYSHLKRAKEVDVDDGDRILFEAVTDVITTTSLRTPKQHGLDHLKAQSNGTSAIHRDQGRLETLECRTDGVLAAQKGDERMWSDWLAWSACTTLPVFPLVRARWRTRLCGTVPAVMMSEDIGELTAETACGSPIIQLRCSGAFLEYSLCQVDISQEKNQNSTLSLVNSINSLSANERILIRLPVAGPKMFGVVRPAHSKRAMSKLNEDSHETASNTNGEKNDDKLPEQMLPINTATTNSSDHTLILSAPAMMSLSLGSTVSRVPGAVSAPSRIQTSQLPVGGLIPNANFQQQPLAVPNWYGTATGGATPSPTAFPLAAGGSLVSTPSSIVVQTSVSVFQPPFQQQAAGGVLQPPITAMAAVVTPMTPLFPLAPPLGISASSTLSGLPQLSAVPAAPAGAPPTPALPATPAVPATPPLPNVPALSGLPVLPKAAPAGAAAPAGLPLIPPALLTLAPPTLPAVDIPAASSPPPAPDALATAINTIIQPLPASVPAVAPAVSRAPPLGPSGPASAVISGTLPAIPLATPPGSLPPLGAPPLAVAPPGVPLFNPARCPTTSWSAWQPWSTCTDHCGGCGTQQRFRSCNNLDAVCICPGLAFENQPCNFIICMYPRQTACCGNRKPTSANNEFICA